MAYNLRDKILLYTFLIPFVYICSGCATADQARQRSKRRERARQAKVARKRTPQALPKIRKINLSETKVGRPAQSSSFLLSRLPPEIRAIIFEYIYVNTIVHLHQIHQRVVFNACPGPSECKVEAGWPRRLCPNDRDIKSDLLDNGISIPNPNQFSSHHANLLSPLLACRQIYQEAISYLYSTPIFDVIDPSVVVFLADRCLLPKRLQQIRHLQLRCIHEEDTWMLYGEAKPPTIWPSWGDFWQVVDQRMQLQSFKLDVLYTGPNTTLQSAWVQPMLQLHGLAQVSVQVKSIYDASDISLHVQLNDALERSMLQK
ncbi:MAG: hypothetical protein Q9213_001294 [Squamulea squamosa]